MEFEEVIQNVEMNKDLHIDTPFHETLQHLPYTKYKKLKNSIDHPQTNKQIQQVSKMDRNEMDKKKRIYKVCLSLI